MVATDYWENLRCKYLVYVQLVGDESILVDHHMYMNEVLISPIPLIMDTTRDNVVHFQ